MKESLPRLAPDIVLLQETKLEVVDSFVIRSLWVARSTDWVFAPCGASGGLIIIWNSMIGSKVEALFGEYSLTVHLSLRGRGEWWLTNVYGPLRVGGRSDFMEELTSLNGLCSPRWLIGGDFNVVRFSSEKLRTRSQSSSMRNFDSFIRDCGLIDPPLVNAKFTWSVGGQKRGSIPS